MKNFDLPKKLKEIYLKTDAIRAELEELEADYRNVDLKEGEPDLYVELMDLSSGASDFANVIFNVNEKINEVTS